MATISFVASAQSSTHEIVIPAGVQAGDVGVLFDMGYTSGGTVTSVVPSGWTSLADTDESTGRGIASYKILGASDPGATITGMNATEDNKVMFVVRGNAAISAVTPSVWQTEFTGGNPAGQTASASGQTVPLAVFGGAATKSSTTDAAFSTASPAFDATLLNDAGNSSLIAGYKLYNASPADHSIDMNDIKQNWLVSGYLKFIIGGGASLINRRLVGNSNLIAGRLVA